MTAGLGHYGWVWIVALAAILAFALYRRGRRLIGHQRVNDKRIFTRIMLLAVLIALALSSYTRGANAVEGYEAAAAGFVLGVVVALAALRFTQMGRDKEGVWYVPNLYLGIGLIGLLVARFAYEYFVVFPQIRQAAAEPGAVAAITVGPLIHGLLFVVLGYYLIYYIGILWLARRVPPEPPRSLRERP